MKRLKKTDRVINYLLSIGCQEIKSRSKYRQFESQGNTDIFFFVGKNGALRKGKNASKSFSLTRIIDEKISLGQI